MSLLLAAAPASLLTHAEKPRLADATQHASFETSQDDMTVPNPADPFDPALLLDNYTATLLPSAQLAQRLQTERSQSRRLQQVQR